jgi:hypothetical protein
MLRFMDLSVGITSLFVVTMTTTIAACAALRDPVVRPYVPSFGPAVSESCVDAARRHVLVEESPRRVGSYAVTPLAKDRLYLRREGRALSEEEGKTAFAALRPAGLSMGMSALYGSARCRDVSRASCLHFTLWLCQTSLERFGQELDAALAHAGAADGELGVEVEVLEAHGPKCAPDASCPLDHHYGSPQGTYDPKAKRRALGDGGGRCDRDNDCEGADSNSCHAWYLRGGIENAVYISRPMPTFCGCIEGACTWFDQP